MKKIINLTLYSKLHTKIYRSIFLSIVSMHLLTFQVLLDFLTKILSGQNDLTVHSQLEWQPNWSLFFSYLEMEIGRRFKMNMRSVWISFGETLMSADQFSTSGQTIGPGALSKTFLPIGIWFTRVQMGKRLKMIIACAGRSDNSCEEFSVSRSIFKNYRRLSQSQLLSCNNQLHPLFGKLCMNRQIKLPY